MSEGFDFSSSRGNDSLGNTNTTGAGGAVTFGNTGPLVDTKSLLIGVGALLVGLVFIMSMMKSDG